MTVFNSSVEAVEKWMQEEKHTRFECSFSILSPVSSVVFQIFFQSSPLVSSVKLQQSSAPVEIDTSSQTKKMKETQADLEENVNYTRNEWKRFQPTLETSGKDFKLHSKRV